MTRCYIIFVFLCGFWSCNNSLENDINMSSPSRRHVECSGIVEEKLNMSDEDINLAFQLSILSGLSYADWSKKNLNLKNTVDFEMCRAPTKAQSVIGYLKKMSSEMYEGVLNFVTVKNIAKSPKSVRPRRACPAHSYSRKRFTHLWFFNGWSEKGLWHDTEVLVSMNAEAIAIVFRGSENVADLVTSSQFQEPVRHSNFFRNVTQGSVHRGIFNAYRMVDRGEIVPIGGYASVIKVKGAEVDIGIRSAYRDCLLKRNASILFSEETLDKRGESCVVSGDVNLSSLLFDTASMALKSGKNVYLGGHSLGGALATFLAVDLLVNSEESLTFLKAGFTAPNVTGKSTFKTSNKISNALRMRQHQSLMNNIHLYTFGEPEIADDEFFEDIRKSFSHVEYFTQHRYYDTSIISLA